MFHSPHKSSSSPLTVDEQLTRSAGGRHGFTMIELLMAVSITSMLSVVLGALMVAVQTAREYSNGLETATTQATATIDRIRYIVSQAGVYRIAGQPTTVGLAVVNHRWASTDLPDVLVIWSGGRNGGLADTGTLYRLPHVDELVIYSPDPGDATRLVEITVPGNTTDIDFRDASFPSDILALIGSNGTERVLICERVRRSSQADLTVETGNIRFALEQTPPDSELQPAMPGTAAWYGLPWVQGIVSGDSGLRQANIRMELQVTRHEGDSPETDGTTTAIPYFGSASRRYVYKR
jgi:prepilin-type N-terminal cleavage/methylation domain-containing protein